MSDAVIVAILTTVGAIISAILLYLGILANRTHKTATAALHEVRNSHDTNLRDDLDEKFEGLAGLVKTLAVDVGGLKSGQQEIRDDVAGVKEDIRIIHREQSQDRRAVEIERERIRKLEDTSPARPRVTKPKGASS